MREILSKHNDEKKAKRNQIILGIFLVFIMFFSVAEYAFLANDNGNQNLQNQTNIPKADYNGFEFSLQNGFWILNKDENSFVFKYNPNQLEKINFSLSNWNYVNKTIYINSEDIISESEIRVNLAQFAEKIENSQNKNCNNNFIEIKEANESKISQNKNCILIEGKKENLPQLTDEFLFKILGVEP